MIRTAEVEASFRALAQRRGWGDDWDEIEARGVELLMPNPTHRLARREEVADLVAFVSSERAGYLNGAHLRIERRDRLDVLTCLDAVKSTES